MPYTHRRQSPLCCNQKRSPTPTASKWRRQGHPQVTVKDALVVSMTLLDIQGRTSRLKDGRIFVLDIYRIEARDKNKAVSQHRNGVDCGTFVLHYLYLFVQNAPTIFTLDGYLYFEDWFSQDDLDDFQTEIYFFLM
ncbi:putative papain-like cysteine peptidase superfamily [Dioscorea sansibarensis]